MTIRSRRETIQRKILIANSLPMLSKHLYFALSSASRKYCLGCEGFLSRFQSLSPMSATEKMGQHSVTAARVQAPARNRASVRGVARGGVIKHRVGSCNPVGGLGGTAIDSSMENISPRSTFSGRTDARLLVSSSRICTLHGYTIL